MSQNSINRRVGLGISVMLALFLVGACFEEEEQADPCQELCQYFKDCKLCLLDANKKCRTLQGCQDHCNGKASLKNTWPCIKQVKGCDKTKINACMSNPPKKDGGVPPKDTGVGKKDGGGKSYRGKGRCKLAFQDMKCVFKQIKTGGTSSTYDFPCVLGEFKTGRIDFDGELKLNRFYGEHKDTTGYIKANMELVFDHAKDQLVTWKQVVSYYDWFNGKKKQEAQSDAKGGNRPTTTTSVTGKALTIKAEHKGTKVCNYIVDYKFSYYDTDTPPTYTSNTMTKYSCTAASKLSLECKITLQ